MQQFFQILIIHNYWPLIAFVPAIINMYLFFYLYFYFEKTKLSRTLSYLIFFLCAWQIGQGILMTTDNIVFAERIESAMNTFILIGGSCSVYLSLFLTKELTKKNQLLIDPLIYLPTIFFVMLNILGLNPIKLTYHSFFGFIPINDDSLLIRLNLIFIATLSFLTIFLLISGWARSKNKIHKKQLVIITIGFLIPAVQGVVTEIIFPNVLGLVPIPLTTTSFSIFSIMALIALRKYELLQYAPKYVSENLLNTISDAVLISDNDGLIKYVNPSFVQLFQYQENELLDNQGYFLLANKASIALVRSMVEERKKGKSTRYEVEMKKKDGTILTVKFNSSPYYKNNSVIGALSVIHDITSVVEQQKHLTQAMILGEEKEMYRLAKELHDGVAQNIAVLKMNLEAIEINALSPEDQEIMHNVFTISRETLAEIRHISHNLYPLNESESLSIAIEKLILRHKNIDIQFEFNGLSSEPSPGITTSIITNLYRILQEFINNSVKFSNATIISIDLNYTPNSIHLELCDNGSGFDQNLVHDLAKGIGLKNMKQRTEAIGGIFDLQSELGKGTRLKVSAPI